MTYSARESISATAGIPVLMAAGLLASAGSAVLSHWTQPPAGIVVASGLLCFAGSVASLFVTVWMSRTGEDGVVGGVVAGMLVRGSATLVGAIAFVSAGLGQRQVVGGWILYWYLTFLVVEVVWLARQMSPTSPTREAQSC